MPAEFDDGVGQGHILFLPERKTVGNATSAQSVYGKWVSGGSAASTEEMRTRFLEVERAENRLELSVGLRRGKLDRFA